MLNCTQVPERVNIVLIERDIEEQVDELDEDLANIVRHLGLVKRDTLDLLADCLDSEGGE